MFTRSKIIAQAIARLVLFLCQLSSVSPALAMTTAADANVCSGLAAQGSFRVGDYRFHPSEPRFQVRVAHMHLFGVGY